MLDQGNRTFIGSVVFVDIVGYSKKSVSEQITLKDRFTSILADCLKDIALEQRIILDTGDGAAMSFLGDPEDALFVSMHMREFLQRAYADLNLPENAAQEDIDIGPQGDLSVRIGINLGPVKLLRDINGHPNIVGDGINVAQRIMSFARPGQIVVSRSYFDVVSVISDEFAKIFKYEGSRTDKHVREHEIYVVGESVAAFDQARANLANRAASTNPNSWSPHHSDIGSDTYAMRAMLDETGGDATQSFWQDREKLTLVGSILGALVLALIVAAWMKKKAEPATNAPTIAAPAAQLLPPIAPPPATTVAPPGAAKFGDTPSATLSPVATAPTAPAVPANRATGVAITAKPSSASGGASETAKTAALKRANDGTLRLNIDPWGNVFVNGRVVGVSPPLKRYDLPAGKYKIEVKNGTFTSYVTDVEVKAKEDVIVKHRFQ